MAAVHTEDTCVQRHICSCTVHITLGMCTVQYTVYYIYCVLHSVLCMSGAVEPMPPHRVGP